MRVEFLAQRKQREPSMEFELSTDRLRVSSNYALPTAYEQHWHLEGNKALDLKVAYLHVFPRKSNQSESIRNTYITDKKLCQHRLSIHNMFR